MPSDLIKDSIGLIEKLIDLTFYYVRSSLDSRTNKSFAYVLSFLFTGIGVAYLGNVRKGILIFLASLVLIPLRIYSRLGLMFSVISFLLWLYGMYATYQEFKLIE